MALDVAEVARRLDHVRGLLFTDFVVVGLVAVGVVWLAFPARRDDTARDRVLALVSLGVVGWFGSPVLVAAALAYLGLCYTAVERLPRGPWSTAAIVALLGLLVVAPVRAVGALGDLGPHARECTAFATNMVLLRVWAYAWDRRHGRTPAATPVRFLVAMLFFPTFVNGPVEVAGDLERDWTPIDRAALRDGARRLALGCGKLLAVGLALPPAWTAVLGRMGDAAAWELWGVGALLYVWFYLSFSAWTDVAIGLARLSGRRVRENFYAPWRAIDVADFWRRWHVSFGRWLRDYVYIPLGGNRHARARNVAITFLASAAWHVWGTLKLLGFGYYPVSAWSGFVVWGLLNAAGVLATPWLARIAAPGTAARIGAARVATFAFAAFCWVAFFLPASVSAAGGVGMLLRMLWPFSG